MRGGALSSLMSRGPQGSNHVPLHRGRLPVSRQQLQAEGRVGGGCVFLGPTGAARACVWSVLVLKLNMVSFTAVPDRHGEEGLVEWVLVVPPDLNASARH